MCRMEAPERRSCQAGGAALAGQERGNAARRVVRSALQRCSYYAAAAAAEFFAAGPAGKAALGDWDRDWERGAARLPTGPPGPQGTPLRTSSSYVLEDRPVDRRRCQALGRPGPGRNEDPRA